MNQPDRSEQPSSSPLHSGRLVRIRDVLPCDSERVQTFVRELSSKARYNRYCSAIRELPASVLRRTLDTDGMRSVTLLAIPGSEVRITAGMGEYRTDEDGTCEIALVVRDAWQRDGLGTLLLSQLLARARLASIPVVHGYVLYDNSAMLAFARARGFSVGSGNLGPSLLRVSRSLESANDA